MLTTYWKNCHVRGWKLLAHFSAPWGCANISAIVMTLRQSKIYCPCQITPPFAIMPSLSFHTVTSLGALEEGRVKLVLEYLGTRKHDKAVP